jgi:hypothetical protein
MSILFCLVVVVLVWLLPLHAHPPAAPSRRLGNCPASLDYLGPGRLSIQADGCHRQQPGSADNLECAS